MRKLKSYFIITITILVTLYLNINVGKVPPIAKFLNPFQGFWQNAESLSYNQFPTHLSITGLEDSVSIHLDQNLIPHIQAKNDKDLYFVQGYITAFHRLWQMEFQTHAAAGRLSEIVGSIAIPYDRLQRRKGMVYAAKNSLQKVQENILSNEMVTAYTAGINAYINSLNYKKLPIEYKLLSYAPEQWTPLKTSLMSIQMADILSGYEQSLQNIHAFHLLGEKKCSFLYPECEINYQPIIPKNTPWNFKAAPIKFIMPDNATNTEAYLPITFKKSSPPNKLPLHGSNNWAVSGTKTVTKYPYLANDPHLNLRLPAIWYGVHLQSPTLNVAGTSLPGTPGILIGFNKSIAWGVTNAAWAVRDWYAIQFKDSTNTEYYYDNLLLKSRSVTEEIKVKNKQSVYDEVIYTHLGPIVYDENFTDPNHYKNLSMKWIGHQPGNELLTFYLINRAENLQDFEHALHYYNIPAQNFAFASIKNDIAMQVGGKLPVRYKNQGKSIMPGNSINYEWQNYIPTDHFPRIVNPIQGYVSSANERTTDKSYPYYYFQFYEENYRNRRINNILSQLTKIDEKAMMRLQNDNYNLAAEESMPFLLSHIDTTQLDKDQQLAYNSLIEWDFKNEIEQIAPSIFKAWQEQIGDMLWSSLHKHPVAISKPSFYQSMYILKNNAIGLYLDLETYPTLQALITDSFKKTVQILKDWQKVHKKPYKWGDYRAIDIPHLAQIPSFGVQRLRMNGGESIVNANDGSHGTSMKLIVSLGKDPKAWLIYPGGQSGNPGSPYYINFLEHWRTGKYITLSLKTPEFSKKNPGNKMIFVPLK